MVTSIAVIGGIDTHADTHALAVIDSRGQLLGTTTVPATAAGNRQALAWLASHGTVHSVGVEGTGSYGAQLARHLTAHDLKVIEVDRADRKTRRRKGKSDPLDAEAAARAVLAGVATGVPKTRTGPVESLRALKATKRAAMKAQVAARSALVQMVITAPQSVRDQLDGLKGTARVEACARLRPDRTLLHDPVHAVKLALRRTARRCQVLAEEIAELNTDIEALVSSTAPRLLDAFGVGADTAAQLLITAGDNPERIRSEASFAALCGVSPIPASSGRTDRHRLNRGGDRLANEALWRIVMVRLSHDPKTKAYLARRSQQGLRKREIIRCLKRYIVRELLPIIRAELSPATDNHNPLHEAA
nr:MULTISPECIES: IS110 family transposase [unclassified Ornithinimicrobium]